MRRGGRRDAAWADYPRPARRPRCDAEDHSGPPQSRDAPSGPSGRLRRWPPTEYRGGPLARGRARLRPGRPPLTPIRRSALASPQYRRGQIDVTTHTRRGFSLDAITVHRATTLRPEDRDTVRGIPVTSLPRTIIDLATCVSQSSLEYAIHRAEAQRKLTPADLRDALERHTACEGHHRRPQIIGAPGHDLDAKTRSRGRSASWRSAAPTTSPTPRSTGGFRSISPPAGSRSTSAGRPSALSSRSTNTRATALSAPGAAIPSATPPSMPLIGK